MRNIYIYENDGKCQVEEFFKGMNKKLQKKFKFQLEYIIDEHNLLTEPHVKHFSIEKYRQLYELRIKATGIMVRVIFYEHNNDITLLHAFYKRDRKDTERALEVSLRLLNLMLKNSENITCRELTNV